MRLLAAKVALGGLGLTLGLAGMALELQWLVWAAVGLVGTAFVLRFLKREAAP